MRRQAMSIRDLLFKAVMNRAPRVRGFTKKCYFAHPFLDAFFVWFPLGNMKYRGAEIGEIYKVASRINERDPMSWAKMPFGKSMSLTSFWQAPIRQSGLRQKKKEQKPTVSSTTSASSIKSAMTF
jgi:hypothetical protein